MSEAQSPSAWTRIKPALLWGFCFLLFNAGPFNWQYRDAGPKQLRWQFRLYHSFGGKVCDLQYFEPGPDGDWVYLERWKVLGFDSPRDMPNKLRRIGPKQLRKHHQKVCRARRKQLGTQPVIYAEARCMSKDQNGWAPKDEDVLDVCKPRPKKKKKKKKKPKSAKRPGGAGK